MNDLSTRIAVAVLDHCYGGGMMVSDDMVKRTAAVVAGVLSAQPPAEAQAVASLREMLELREATQNGRVTEKHELDIVRDARAALSAQPRPVLDYTDIANRAQAVTGRSIHPSTVKAVLEAAGIANTQPASAPVGVDGITDIAVTSEFLAGVNAALLAIAALPASDDESHEDAYRAVEALAQQPAPVAPVGVEDVRAGRDIVDEFIQCAEVGRPHGNLLAQAKDWIAWAESALTQQPAATLPDEDDSDLTAAYMAGRHDGRKESRQPAAVDGAIRSLPALWRQREPDNGEGYTDYDRGYDQASDECADALEAALAQPQGEG